MRIIAGLYKGRKLPELKANGVRPTLDRVRENLFNIISQRVASANFLDLFAGSGAVGIEALSRGAEKVFFCDKSKEVVAHLKKIGTILNIDLDILCRDYKSALKSLCGEFDIIYLDPPYEMDGNDILNSVYESSVCSSNTLVIYERMAEKPFELNANFEIIDDRKYGIANLTFLRKKNG